MKVLLVEDNKGDQVILQEALQDAGVHWELNIVEDGVQAIEYLTGRGPFSNSIKPDLVILDLNMPRKNGREVLEEIRKDPKLEHILVVILSNSRSEKDICQCYRLKANLYMRKPSGYEESVNFAHMMKFWKNLVHICSHG